MAQTKKEEVRAAILCAAFALFRDKGYNGTSVPLIARTAGTSTANVYVYFGSKLEILFTLYGPWLSQRLDILDRALARTRSRRARLEKMLLALWRDLPRDDNGFSSNLTQALSGAALEGYSPVWRELFLERIARWMTEFLDLAPKAAEQVAGILVMAFDGFVINARLSGGVTFNESTARFLSRLLVDDPGPNT
jgi:AcrR family transcriptional regulator